MEQVDIVDVRINKQVHNGEIDLRQDIIDGLSRPTGEKELPTLLLYDERGLRLFEEITIRADEYYPFAAEERILKENASEIVEAMTRSRSASGTAKGSKQTTILELGAG